MTKQPWGLMLLIGRQLVPNLSAVLSLARLGLIDTVVVVHSSHTVESLDPAQQLVALLQRLQIHDPSLFPPHLRVVMEEVDALAGSVMLTAKAVMDECPGKSWVLNTTGGNKPMSLGLSLLAQDARVHAVIYRDLDAGWVRFCWAGALALPVETPLRADEGALGQALVVQPVQLQDLPLGEILIAQFGAGDLIGQLSGQEVPPVSALDWLNHMLKGSKRRWADYLMEQGCLVKPVADGYAAELFVGTLLKLLGARVVCGVEFKHEAQILQEIDAVAVLGDRLVFVDIKLSTLGVQPLRFSGGRPIYPPMPGKTEQIRIARETAEKAGGLGARSVLLRPRWSKSDMRDYARALRVELVQQSEARNLVSILARQLGATVENSAEARRITERLHALDGEHLDRLFRHSPT